MYLYGHYVLVSVVFASIVWSRTWSAGYNNSGITVEGALMLNSTLFFKKAPCFARKGPFCNVIV